MRGDGLENRAELFFLDPVPVPSPDPDPAHLIKKKPTPSWRAFAQAKGLQMGPFPSLAFPSLTS